ncbi:MAG TPA: hypothetical protein VFH43_09650 [Candidatus Kapabacteria bacterium]|nr:hypothetical protein [Candidatus Kapabacteria bacterium]
MEPLPPVKEVEYRCIIGRLFDELSGMEYVTFAFETAKEFSSFRYEIAVRYKVTPGALEFRVLGMTATRTMMPAHGTARSVLRIPALQPGVYNVLLIKSDGTENQFVLEVGKKGFQIHPPIPDKRFIDLVIEPYAVMQGAKLASTVTTEPPAPLIPRTIQKRQPAPPTPEEQAILDSLKSETAEERDAREEMELFGGSKRVPKSELAESAKELEELATGKAGAAVAEKPKKGKEVDIEDDMDDKPIVKKPSSASSKTEAKPASKAAASKPVDKPAAKPVEKPAAKPVHATAKPVAKTAAKPAPKPAPAKPVAKAPVSKAAPSKVAAKPAPMKGKVASGPIKTSASKTPAKVAPKNAPKPAPAKKTPPKSVSAKTGSSKTSKSTPAKKGAPAKKR